MATDPTFGYPRTPHDLSLDGQRLEPVTLVGYGGGLGPESAQLELLIASVSTPDGLLAPGSLYGNVSSLGDRLMFGNAAIPVEVAQAHPAGFSSDGVVYQYVDRPRLIAAVPRIVNPDLAAPILVLGRGFRRTPALACRFGIHWGPSALFLNETAIECRPPALSVAPGDVLAVTVTLNGLDVVPAADSGDPPVELVVVGIPEPTAVEPTVVFVGEEGIVVDVFAVGLWDSEWLSCGVAGLRLSGAFHEDPDTGAQFVRCIIPSTQFLRAATGTAPGEAGAVAVEVSNDGQLYSAAGLQLLLASPEQLQGVAPSNGPARGGTVIDIALAGVVPVNAVIPQMECVFPGDVATPATFLSSTLIRCTSPPLAELGEGVWEASSWTWAPVGVRLDARRLGSFLFAYTRGVAVTRTEPSDAVPADEGASPADLTVAVHGTAFLPARGAGLRCRFEVAPLSFIEVEATYTRNGTLACTIPGTTLAEAWAGREPGATAAIVGIEVSLNGGQQYTQDGVGLVLRAAERLREAGAGEEPAVTPSFTYTEGGALLTLRYDRAYAPSSPRAACIFRTGPPATSTPREIRTPLYRVDEAAAAVECFAPPAHLLGPELAESGGLVALLLTTNGRDASANSWPLLYRRAPEISQIVPLWLLAEASSVVSVVGVNFFEPVPGSEFRLTSLSDPSRERSVPVVYVDGQHLELAWPASAFAVGEQVRLQVALDGGSVY